MLPSINVAMIFTNSLSKLSVVIRLSTTSKGTTMLSSFFYLYLDLKLPWNQSHASHSFAFETFVCLP